MVREIEIKDGERARKSWQTPQVIVGMIEQAELNVGVVDDGSGGPTPDNS